MSCHRFSGGIICFSPWGRLKLGNRYVWVDFHEYCGPTFFWNSDMTKMYEPVDDNDPIWAVFEVWLTKYQKEKSKAKRK